MNPYIEIMGRKIGLDYAPLVIAEIGINHKGSLKKAKKQRRKPLNIIIEKPFLKRLKKFSRMIFLM